MVEMMLHPLGLLALLRSEQVNVSWAPVIAEGMQMMDGAMPMWVMMLCVLLIVVLLGALIAALVALTIFLLRRSRPPK